MEAENSDKNGSVFWDISTVGLVVVVALGYWCLPEMINFVQPVIVWLNWFIRVVTYISCFVLVISVIGWIYFSNPKTTQKKKSNLWDEYLAADAVPTVVHPPTLDYYNGTEVGEYGCGSYNKEMVQAFEEVETVKRVKKSNCYDGVVVEEEVNSKRSYRRTRSRLEKKTEKKARIVEYRRTESERMAKTASRSSKTIDELSNEEFRTTVETFIMENKMIPHCQNGVADHWHNGVADHWHNGVADQWHNGVADQWQNHVGHTAVPQLQNHVGHTAVPQLQNHVADHRQNGVIDQWQNGSVDQRQNGVALAQWQNGVPQWQWQGPGPGLPYDGGAGRHRYPNNTRPQAGYGSYLAISN